MRLLAAGLLSLLVMAAAPRAELKLGEVVPDISFTAYDEKEYKLSDFRVNAKNKNKGQVVVVYFQSKACPFAIDPAVVNKIIEPFNDPKNGVKFISVWTDKWDQKKVIEKYIAKHEMKYTCAFDKPERKLRDHFGAKQVNATFVMDMTGKLIYRGGLAEMEGTRKVIKNTVIEAVKAAKSGTEAPRSDRDFEG
jgi:peroxiredoxin